ncbi:hypothetical protein BGY98DRAFT_1014639, partial [Russula aff. rugulosa BPL654]
MAVEEMDDRRRGSWSLGIALQQQQYQTSPSCASDHASPTKTEDSAATAIGPSDTGTDASAAQHQHPTRASSTTSSEQRPPADTPRSVSVPPGAPDRAQTKASIPSSARSSASDPL